MLLLLFGWLTEHASGEVGGHDGPGLAQQGGLERVAEAADAGERGYSYGNRHNYKNELRPRGLQFAPSNLGGRAPGEGGFLRGLHVRAALASCLLRSCRRAELRGGRHVRRLVDRGLPAPALLR